MPWWEATEVFANDAFCGKPKAMKLGRESRRSLRSAKKQNRVP